MSLTVIRGGRVVDPASNQDGVVDLVIEDGVVTRVGDASSIVEQLATPQDHVVDATGRWVCPGFIDLHVHLREPGSEYKEDIQSGLAAAAAGGFTTVCPMPNTTPVNDNRAITEMMVARGQESTGARLVPFGAMTKGLRGEELAEMADMREAGVVGVTDDGRCVENAAVMRRVMEYARTFDLLVSQHCEDHSMTRGAQMHEGAISTRLGLRGWPREAEDIIVARDLILAEGTGARYHVAHISSMGAVRLIREAKSRGLPVSAEVTPHHLQLTHDALLTYDTHCKVNPPLRTEEDRAALREALADGTIDCIATDHAPHSVLEKNCAFDDAAVGINGLELAVPSLLPLVAEGVLTLTRLIEALTASPARLVPDVEMGSLKVGARADITIVDPLATWTPRRDALRSKSHNTPLLDQEVSGRIWQTWVAGERVFQS